MTEAELLDRVRAYPNEAIIPCAHEFDTRDEFPAHLVDGLRELGLFGLTIDPEYGGLGMGVGVSKRALELAIAYANAREAFDRPIADHQAIQFKLAEMATKIEASRLLVRSAPQAKDRGDHVDVEAGMAKLFASEACKRGRARRHAHPRRQRLLEGL